MSEHVVNLSIKGVPVDLAERLRARAARNHRSLQRELMAIIEAATAEAEPSPALGASRRRANRDGVKSIDEVVDSLRARFPDPPADVPLGVDIIRAARDER
ncbi:MAG: hypothetical protein LT106_01650 [Burkholderiaceae bacterium]|nr:hypothetical protein [Burkholderiaceae bacterium]